VDAPGHPPNGAGALHLDRAGRLWIASSTGLFRCDEPCAAQRRFDRVLSAGVQSLAEDRWGRIYAATARGVFRVDPATGHERLYSTTDGFPAADIDAALAEVRRVVEALRRVLEAMQGQIDIGKLIKVLREIEDQEQRQYELVNKLREQIIEKTLELGGGEEPGPEKRKPAGK
jgi:ligand-binding sensor domain-containing protein